MTDSTGLVTESAEALADLIASHDAYHVNEDGWTVCICGHVAMDDDDDGSHARHVAALIASGAVRPAAEVRAEALREVEDVRAAKRIAAAAADRFRDVISECLDHHENPGDDVLVAELRDHFGKTGPEPTRWRDFLSGALAVVDQINAERRDGTR